MTHAKAVTHGDQEARRPGEPGSGEAEGPMTQPRPIDARAGRSSRSADGPRKLPRGSVLPPTRYRRPGYVIGLIAAAGLVAAAAVLAALVPALLRSAAAAASGVGPATAAGHALTGTVQLTIAAAALAGLAAALWYRRFRVLVTVAAGFVAAAAALTGLTYLAAPGRAAGLPLALRQGSWLAGGGFPDPALLAGLAAAAVAASPWLSRPWRRAAWVALLLIGATRLVTGGLVPMQLALALAAGLTVGTGLLVAFGVPDRRMGSASVAEALRAGGLPVSEVTGPLRQAKGSRPFQAVTEDGHALFVKVLGYDQRNADLLYRAWRGLRLRGVGDTRPASSLVKTVEHEALLSVLAERAGVAVPRVGQVIRAADGSVLLTMQLIAGLCLEDVPADCITDQLAVDLWREVGRLHQAGIAHRSLRCANVMISQNGRPVLVDFSFAELAATSRQRAIDVAELLTSLAGRIGPDRAAGTAAAAIGPGGVAAAVPVLQPLALSAGTRRAIRGQDGLLKKTRAAAATASGGEADQGLARLQRVRPRTLLVIASLAGAFYFLLPQVEKAGSSWHALGSAHWAWLPVILAMSAVTYVASALALIGSVPGRVPFGPSVLVQGASSFINRVSPANIGGMALNARFLQQNGTGTPASVAAVGVNSLAGAVVHIAMIAVFFTLAGHDLTKAFKLPSGSKILLVLAVLLAVVGLVLATRPGRHWARKQLIPGARAAAGSLRLAAASPAKLSLLFGGSALVTLAYIGALAASVGAFGGGPGLVVLGAVYLGAAALAAVAPTPGGLGAIEAALVAGLTGVGIQPGPAVSAVVLYRLATYWLPVLPGWLCWRFLQHRELV
jgi:glycosyltransferase 2 family protein